MNKEIQGIYLCKRWCVKVGDRTPWPCLGLSYPNSNFFYDCCFVMSPTKFPLHSGMFGLVSWYALAHSPIYFMGVLVIGVSHKLGCSYFFRWFIRQACCVAVYLFVEGVVGSTIFQLQLLFVLEGQGCVGHVSLVMAQWHVSLGSALRLQHCVMLSNIGIFSLVIVFGLKFSWSPIF